MKAGGFRRILERCFRKVCQKCFGTQNLIAKIGFLNVKIKRSPNVNKTFSRRFDSLILLPEKVNCSYFWSSAAPPPPPPQKKKKKKKLSRDMWFPAMWHFDKCRLRLVWGFAGRTYHIVENLTYWPNFFFYQFFQEYHQCQFVSIQIRSINFSCLIWFQTV